jgi:hypothetical protein
MKSRMLASCGALLVASCGGQPSPATAVRAPTTLTVVTEEIVPGVRFAWTRCFDAQMEVDLYVRGLAIRTAREDAVQVSVDGVPARVEVQRVDFATSTVIYFVAMTCQRHEVEVRGWWGAPLVRVLEPLTPP